MTDLLMIVPSRGRPGNIAALHDAWSAASIGAAELLVAVDDDDPALDDYLAVCSDRSIRMVTGPRLRMVGTLNHVAVTSAPLYFALGFLGDDHRPRSFGWDRRYVEDLRDLGTGIVYGNDLLAKQRLPTQFAMTSDIVQTLGAMIPAPVKHLWADNQIFDLGDAIGRLRYLPDVVVEHCHPLGGTAADDDGYREVNSPEASEADRLIYADWYTHRREADVEKLKALL